MAEYEICILPDHYQRIHEEFRNFHLLPIDKAPPVNSDIILREYDRKWNLPTGRTIKARVIDVFSNEALTPGWCIVSFLPYFPVVSFSVRTSTFLNMYDMYLEKCKELDTLREEV